MVEAEKRSAPRVSLHDVEKGGLEGSGSSEACMAADHSHAPSTDNQSSSLPNVNKEGKPQRADAASRANGRIIVSFKPDDRGNPVNWPTRKKYYIIFVGIASVINSTLGSSLPSGAMPDIAKAFNVTNDQKLVLPVSMFLVGYVVGPLVFAPLSEHFGRKAIFVSTFIVFTMFTMACALSPNYTSLVVFRLFCGMCASAPIAIVGGLYADIYNDPRKRGRAMAYFMAATTFGPMLGPLISGFISATGWRWTFWFGLILAGVTLPFICFMPETYAAVLLQRRAAKLRTQTGNPSYVARSELVKREGWEMVTVVLTRPVRMIIHESIVLFTCMYLSLAYAIYYLFFQAYPIIFGPKGIYGMSEGISGLAFLPIGVGATVACGIFLWYDSFLTKAQKRHAPWAEIEEYRRLPLACLGGPLYVIALFWLGWSSYSNVHWIVPMLSGACFGLGFMLIFMAMLNYLTDAYQTFAASAQGVASCCRSLGGALLPLATTPMYKNLGVHWASSLLAFVALGMAVIPFAFIKYGNHIRENSKFCQDLKEMQRKEAEEDRQLFEEAQVEEEAPEQEAAVAPFDPKKVGSKETV